MTGQTQGTPEESPHSPPPSAQSAQSQQVEIGGNFQVGGEGNVIDFSQKTIYQIAPPAEADIKSRPLIGRSPYIGLRKFELRDKDLFFGRDQLIDRLRNRLNEAPFLLVLGASGSGKSSLIRAGLIPRLIHDLGSGFRELIVTPDRDPFDSFRSSLRSAGFAQVKLEPLQTGKPEAMLQVVTSLKQPDDDWLIFIDQFEELFTLCQDLKVRQAFIDGLLQLVQARLPRLQVVLAMRADFLDRLGAYPQLSGILQRSELITDMGDDELRRAIAQPAAYHGVVFESGLVTEIIHDLKGRPDSASAAERVSLPLLQYTLRLLWNESDRLGELGDRTLRTHTYRDLGGVRGALQRHIDEIYAPLSDAQKQAAKHIFLQLVDTLSADAGTTAVGKAISRRAHRTDFAQPAEQQVLEQLINAGLLVSDRPASDDDATVELAHETLIDAWDTLKAWIEESRPLIRLKNQLKEDATRWYALHQSHAPQADAELWQGTRQKLLLSRRDELRQRFGAFKPDEAAFIDACERLSQRQLRFYLYLAMGAIAASTVIMGLGVAVTLQWRQAEQNSIQALAQTAQARFIHNPNTLEALLPALEAGQRLQQRGWLIKTPALHEVVMRALTQSVVWVREVNQLEGHTTLVDSVSLSQDGTLLASGSHDNTVRLWRRNGEPLHPPLEGHTEAVMGVSLSPDGTQVASVSLDRSLKLWDTQTGQLLDDRPDAHDGAIYAVAFDAAGQTLATASEDGTVKLWAVQGDRLSPSMTFTRHTRPVRSVAFGPNGAIASGDEAGLVWLWNRQGTPLRPAPIAAYRDENKQIRSDRAEIVFDIDFNQQGNFATAGLDVDNGGLIRIWSPTGERIQDLPGNEAGFLSVSFSPDNEWLVASDGAGQLHLWRSTGSARRLFDVYETLDRRTTSRANSISMSRDGLVAVGSNDASVELWRMTVPWQTLLRGHTQTLQDAVVAKDGSITTASEDGTVRHWTAEGKPVWTQSHGEGAQVIRVSRHPQQPMVVSADSLGVVRFWNLDTGQPLKPPLQAHDQLIYSIGFNADGQAMATSSADGTVKLWRLDDLSTPVTIQPESWVYSTSFSPDGRLATASADGTINLWDAAGKPLQPSVVNNAGVLDLAFNPQGTLLVLGDERGAVKLWDLSQNQPREVGRHTVAVWSVSISADGQWFASASDDSTIKLWQLEDGTPLTTLTGHTGNVNSVSFDPGDRHILVSAGQDTIAIRWVLNQPDLNGLLASGCQWARDYLQTHPPSATVPSNLCNFF